MKIVCFGDSNTWGFDPRGPYSGRYAQPWPDILARKLCCTVVNQGENGREIPKCGVSFPEDTDVLIVMLGTNDLLQFWPAEAACEKMKNFLKSLMLPQEKILLVGPPPMTFGEWVLDQELIDDSQSLNRFYERLAEELGAHFTDTGLWNIPLAYDGVHLTEEAQTLFADQLAEYIVKEFQI